MKTEHKIKSAPPQSFPPTFFNDFEENFVNFTPSRAIPVEKGQSFFFGRNPDNQPPPNPKLEERKTSEGTKVPWQTTPENEEGSFQCPYCDHPPYKYHKALLTHLETKHLDIKT